MFFAVLGVGTCVYGIASYVGILHEKCQIPESRVELDEAKAARCASKRMTGSEKIDAGKSLGIKSCEKNTESEKTGAPWSGRDWCMAAGLTVLFAVMAFVNLGSMKAPQTAYEFEKNDSHGNEMVLRFDGSVTISEAQVIWVERRRDILYARFRMPREMAGMPSGKRQNCYLYTAGIQWKFITALTN